jgi:hypothetical protein
MPSTPLHSTPSVNPAIFNRQVTYRPITRSVPGTNDLEVGMMQQTVLTAHSSMVWSIDRTFVSPSTPLGSSYTPGIPPDFTGGSWSCKEQNPDISAGEPFGTYEEVWEYKVSQVTVVWPT